MQPMAFESTASTWSRPSNQTQSVQYKLSDRCLTSRTGAIGKDELNLISIPISGALFSEIDWFSYYNVSLLRIILEEHKTRWHFGETHLTAEWWIISGLRISPAPSFLSPGKGRQCVPIRFGDQISQMRLKRRKALLF